MAVLLCTPRGGGGPAKLMEARLGAVHFIFPQIQICTRLLPSELFKDTMYTAHISSSGSHFLTARVLVYWTYKVSKFGYGQTKWMITMNVWFLCRFKLGDCFTPQPCYNVKIFLFYMLQNNTHWNLTFLSIPAKRVLPFLQESPDTQKVELTPITNEK